MARIQFLQTTIKSLVYQPTEAGIKAVLVLTAPMTPAIAEELKCSFLYDSAGNPRAHIEGLPLDHVLRDIDIHLPSATVETQFDIYRPDLIHKIRVSKADEFSFEIQMRVHLRDHDEDVLTFAKAWNKREFEMAVTSLQGEFDFTGEQPGGTAVDMSGDTEDGPALASVRDVAGKKRKAADKRTPDLTLVQGSVEVQ